MILTKEEILREVKFEPGLDAFQVQQCAVDLRLAESVGLGYRGHAVVKTMEKVTLPNDVVGIVYPRSSMNRRGFTVDATGIVDPGFSGTLTIPVTNWNRVPTGEGEEGMPVGSDPGSGGVMLRAGERVASIVFYRVSAPVEAYSGKYSRGETAYAPDKAEEEDIIARGALSELRERFPAL